jgi:hypothetical protein
LTSGPILMMEADRQEESNKLWPTKSSAWHPSINKTPRIFKETLQLLIRKSKSVSHFDTRPTGRKDRNGWLLITNRVAAIKQYQTTKVSLDSLDWTKSQTTSLLRTTSTKPTTM